MNSNGNVELARQRAEYERLQDAVQEFLEWVERMDEEPDEVRIVKELRSRVDALRHAANLCSKPAP